LPGRLKIALVCFNPPVDGSGAPFQLPNFGLRRIHAALLTDPELAHAEVAMVEHETYDVEPYVADILALEPDIVGLATYVWSFPTFFEVARRLKEARPKLTIVIGGPSARASMFSFDPYREGGRYIDAIVIREGEFSFREIAHLTDRSPSELFKIPGLSVPNGDGWIDTPARPSIDNLDSIPSPIQMGLMPKTSVAYIETYRGCPLSCKFCEWGVTEWGGSGRVFSADYLTHELEAFDRVGAETTFLLDAGLNLNAKAFHNLRVANDRVGFFAKTSFICELYPSLVNDETLRFLEKCKLSYIGIGLQSFNKDVLKTMDRPFSMARFESVVSDVATLQSVVELQIIMGLPGDSPEGFRETVARARQLPVQVRVYYCLVLPDALLTRGDADFDLKFDPHDMKMLSCKGWSAEDLQREREYMNDLAKKEGGSTGPFWWHLPAIKRPLIGKHRPTAPQPHVHHSEAGRAPGDRIRLPQIKP
jgi:radical SAM superfamily enzyme YgiQ (UPF0313 family)